MPPPHDIVQKVWNLCNVLRDDGITYLRYVTDRAELPKTDAIAAPSVAQLQMAMEEMQALQEELGGST